MTDDPELKDDGWNATDFVAHLHVRASERYGQVKRLLALLRRQIELGLYATNADTRRAVDLLEAAQRDFQASPGLLLTNMTETQIRGWLVTTDDTVAFALTLIEKRSSDQQP